MRERTKQGELQEGSGHHVSWQENPYVFKDWGYFPYKWVPDFERITDLPKRQFVSYRPGMRRQVFKPVTHSSWRSQVSSTMVTCRSNSNNMMTVSGSAVLYESVNGMPIPGGDLAEALWLWTESCFPSAETGHYDRWQHVKPSMSTRANLSVFLGELRDFKRMWELLPNRHFKTKWQEGKLSWEDVTAFVNGGHLNYNFGWKPFVKDLNRLYDGYKSFERRLDRFILEADRDLRRRRAEPPSTLSTTYVGPCNNGFYSANYTLNAEVQRASAFDYSYSIPRYSWDELNWRAWLDTVGLGTGLSVVWALTPYSFVADWFTGLGNYLQSTESEWVAPWINFHQSAYSMRITGSSSLVAKTPSQWGGVILPGVNLEFTHYVRRPGLPRSAVTPNLSLDADKIRLGGSLLLAQFMR